MLNFRILVTQTLRMKQLQSVFSVGLYQIRWTCPVWLITWSTVCFSDRKTIPAKMILQSFWRKTQDHTMRQHLTRRQPISLMWESEQLPKVLQEWSTSLESYGFFMYFGNSFFLSQDFSTNCILLTELSEIPIKPLLRPNSIRREIRAVNSEHQMNKNRDIRRKWQIFYSGEIKNFKNCLGVRWNFRVWSEPSFQFFHCW